MLLGLTAVEHGVQDVNAWVGLAKERSVVWFPFRALRWW